MIYLSVKGGEDAGATIAISGLISILNSETSIHWHRRLKVAIIGLLVVYPYLDANNNQSFVYPVNNFLNWKQLKHFWSFYLQNSTALDTDDCGGDYIACPRHTPSKILTKFPTTLIILAKHDVVWHEGFSFAVNLKANNVNVTLNQYNSTVHGFFGTDIGYGRDAFQESVNWIKSISRLSI